MTHFWRVPVAWAAVLAAALLAGCAGMRVESTVRAHSRIERLAQPATYRFERLPSQQAQPEAQQRLEAIADAALARVGLQRNDADARYVVLVESRQERVLSPWADPAEPWGAGIGWGLHWGSRGWGFSAAWRWEQPWWRRELRVLLRESAQGQVVFESQALADGPGVDGAAVLPALFEAALQGFPSPPAEVRRVTVELGR